MSEVPSRLEQLWSIDQAAEYLALSTKTLYGWRTRKYGPPSAASATRSAAVLRKCAPGLMPRTCWRPEAAVGRKPLPIGSWGLIRTYPIGEDEKGKPTRFRALAQYRDFDGVTRVVQASGKTATQASQNLRQALQNRTKSGRHGG